MGPSWGGSREQGLGLDVSRRGWGGGPNRWAWCAELKKLKQQFQCC